DAIQAAAIQDYLTAWSQFSYAGPSFIYTLLDTNSASTNPDDTLGVIRSDWTWKPAAYTIQQWIAAHPQQPLTAQVMAALAMTPSAVLSANSGSTYAMSCELTTSLQNACTA
ncbi:MAG: polysaccharide biosynthesis protein PslG, partial [Mycobacterium sp.]|nr:polysaccharide biosynthesis protein PslG [Mycobacterium sp.]